MGDGCWRDYYCGARRGSGHWSQVEYGHYLAYRPILPRPPAKYCQVFAYRVLFQSPAVMNGHIARFLTLCSTLVHQIGPTTEIVTLFGTPCTSRIPHGGITIRVLAWIRRMVGQLRTCRFGIAAPFAPFVREEVTLQLYFCGSCLLRLCS